MKFSNSWLVHFILSGSGETKFSLVLSSSYWGKTSRDARLVCHSLFSVFFSSLFLSLLDAGPPLSPMFSIQISRPHGRNMCPYKGPAIHLAGMFLTKYTLKCFLSDLAI
jgi:hypothetical protein